MSLKCNDCKLVPGSTVYTKLRTSLTVRCATCGSRTRPRNEIAQKKETER